MVESSDARAAASSRARRKTSYHHQDLRHALLITALDVIAKRGGADFTMREIASALGVTHAAAYRHFSDKAALLDALTAEGFSRLAAYQEEEQRKAPPEPMPQLQALDAAYLRFARENKGFFSLMFTPRQEERPEFSERAAHNERALSTLVSTIEACQRAGLVIPGDPRRIAGYLVLAPHGLAAYESQGHQPLGENSDLPFFPDLAALTELNLIPVLTNPPSPAEIAERCFGAREQSE